MTRRHGQIVRALEDIGHQVVLFPLARADGSAYQRENGGGASPPANRPVKMLSDKNHAALLNVVRERRPSLIILTHPDATDFVPSAVQQGVRSIVATHNLEGSLQMKRGMGRSLINQASVIAAEALYLHKADRVWTVSPYDEHYYRAWYRLRNIRTIYSGMDAQADLASTGVAETVLFVGTFSYRPNIDAARHLVERLMPQVRRQVPYARLILAGSRPTEEVLRWQSESVAVLPDLPDIRTAYEAAAVVAAPIRMGGGSNFKVIEAMAYGKPVVISARAARGLYPLDGEACVGANDEDLIRGIVQLLIRPSEGLALGKKAHDYVSRHYGSQQLRETLQSELAMIQS